jgi:sterol desaturase/sphingolipid hydroxylase (fatty acid hydroxylase superfamily)
MNWLSLRRKHPLGEALSIIFDGLLVIALGLPFWAIMAAFILRSWWGYFVHADVPWTLGPLGKALISPAAHRLHHIRNEQLMGYNFGNTVTLWDRLFGTYLDPAPYIDCETGIAEGSRDWLGELARPFEARYRQKPDAVAAEQPAS